MLVPLKLRNEVFVRENVEQNLKSLSEIDREDLWKAVRTILDTSLAKLPRVLDQHVRENVAGTIVVFGSIVTRKFIAIIKVIKRRVYLLSVIGMKRLYHSTRDHNCMLIADTWEKGGEKLEVSVELTADKDIIWKWQKTDLLSRRQSIGGEILRPIFDEPSLSFQLASG